VKSYVSFKNIFWIFFSFHFLLLIHKKIHFFCFYFDCNRLSINIIFIVSFFLVSRHYRFSIDDQRKKNSTMCVVWHVHSAIQRMMLLIKKQTLFSFKLILNRKSTAHCFFRRSFYSILSERQKLIEGFWFLLHVNNDIFSKRVTKRIVLIICNLRRVFVTLSSRKMIAFLLTLF